MNKLRCAIYTRKSSEDGLEQGFNSLHAQRDACAAFVLSQAGEGWTAIPTIYDDGGYSGGSLDRPGIQALLADIGKGLIDIVVVYKVDRLTRSLADFARIVELFDKTDVSFVSVTQAFNTTTSMGRLTLNVLLSFAQFEREVTGERIRDKVAASKKKGMWMGGNAPLGYDGVDCKLVVNPVEADTVRHIFGRYLELGSVIALTEDLATAGIRSKLWVSRKGVTIGGRTLTRGALYYMLSNEVYRGGIRHRDRVYLDSHPAIIDLATWEQVQARLKRNCPDHPATPRLAAEVLLKGLLYDARDIPMIPVHANRRGRRYRYYVARDVQKGNCTARPRLSRIAMGVIDDFVLAEVPARLRPDYLPDFEPAARIQAALVRVQLTEETVQFRLRHGAASTSVENLPGRSTQHDDGVDITLPITLKHRQGAIIIDAPASSNTARRIDRALLRAVVLARAWAGRLASGEAASLRALAKAEGYCAHYAARLLPLAWLAPDLVQAIVDGRQPAALSLGALTKQPLPIRWEHQRALIERCGRLLD